MDPCRRCGATASRFDAAGYPVCDACAYRDGDTLDQRLTLTETLTRLNACHEAVKWAQGRSPAAAWRTCLRGDWLLWVATTIGVDRRLVVRASCACAREAWPHLDDDTWLPAMLAIHVAEEWAEGRADLEDVEAAAWAARDAAWAAGDAGAAARAAAWAAWAADAGDATWEAQDATWAAQGAAVWAARAAAWAAGDAWDAGDAGAACFARCADSVRRIIPYRRVRASPWARPCCEECGDVEGVETVDDGGDRLRALCRECLAAMRPEHDAGRAGGREP